jgi:hypothetical protein
MGGPLSMGYNPTCNSWNYRPQTDLAAARARRTAQVDDSSARLGWHQHQNGGEAPAASHEQVGPPRHRRAHPLCHRGGNHRKPRPRDHHLTTRRCLLRRHSALGPPMALRLSLLTRAARNTRAGHRLSDAMITLLSWRIRMARSSVSTRHTLLAFLSVLSLSAVGDA